RWVLRLAERVLATDAREPAEPHGEDVLEDDREEEDRDRDPDQRCRKARVVDTGPVSLRREEAQRHTDADREDHRRKSQFDGRRETVLELVGDRARTRDAGAEVAAR